MPHFSRILLCAAIMGGTAFGQTQAPQSSAPAPQAVWTVSNDVSTPESAYYHASSNSIFVSSINGQVTEKDGNGYISRLTPGGRVVNAKWATGLNAPKGLRAAGGTLWVADIDEVVGIAVATGRVTSHVRIDGARFLNDLATMADGTVYVSDSQASRIYVVQGGKAAVFLEGEDLLETPNGVLVDGSRLIVGSMGRGALAPPPPAGRAGARGPADGRAAAGSTRGAREGRAADRGGARGAGRGAPRGGGGRLLAFDLKTKQRTVLTSEPVGGIDGIESDGRGGYLITDVFGSRLVHVPASGTPRSLLQFGSAGADFGYIESRQLAIVPFLMGNSVAAYDLSNALK